MFNRAGDQNALVVIGNNELEARSVSGILP